MRHEQTFKLQQDIYNIIFAHAEFRALGQTYADISGTADAEAKFALLHRRSIHYDKAVAVANGTGAGYYDSMLNHTAVDESRTTLQEYAAVAIDSKDRHLAGMAEKLAARCGLDVISWDIVWSRDADTLDKVRDNANATIMKPENCFGPKQYILEVREVTYE